MKRNHKIVAILAMLLGMALLVGWIYHWPMQKATEANIAALTAQGEPMTLAAVRPPPVPDSENGADIFLKAAALLDADSSLLQTDTCEAMISLGRGKALAAFQRPDAACSDSTNTWSVISQALDQNRVAIQLLGQLPDHPRLDFHIHYERGLGAAFDIVNVHLGDLKKSAQYLYSDLTWQLHAGNTSAAIQDERAVIVLANSAQYQRFLISELVGVAIMNFGQSMLWEILQSTNITADQLASVQQDWENMNVVQGWHDALAMERVGGEISLHESRSSLSEPGPFVGIGKSASEIMGVDDSSDTPLEKVQTDAKIFMWRFWWSYPDEERSVRGYSVLMDTTRFMATNGSYLAALTNQQARLAALQITNLTGEWTLTKNSDFHAIASQGVVSLSGITKNLLRAEVDRRLIISAIALQRFKLAHGNYPRQLDELVPDFVASVPCDPVDGKPLRYRLQTDGTFLIYSIGENGMDDGGNPANPKDPTRNFWLDYGALDWVWPQPGTAMGYTNSNPILKK